MEVQDNCIANNLPQNDVVDFHMQQDNVSPHKSLAEWLNQRNQLLADTCEESLQCCKRDWLNERGESSKENQTGSVLNQCEPSNVTNEMTTITDNQNNGYHFDENVPYIEIESDDDVAEEFIDLTDMHDDIHERSPGSIDLTDNLDLNDTMHTSLLSSYNVVDIASETPNQIPVECINDDEVLSLHSDEASSENSETNNITDLNDHLFTSILSPFCVSNSIDNIDNIETEAGDELLTDVNITEDITTVCNSMLSPVSITDTQKCDIDLTAETSSKRRRKKKKKEKKSTPPPHIIRKIIQQKKEKKWKQKMEYQMKESVKSEIKNEEKRLA